MLFDEPGTQEVGGEDHTVSFDTWRFPVPLHHLKVDAQQPACLHVYGDGQEERRRDWSGERGSRVKG